MLLLLLLSACAEEDSCETEVSRSWDTGDYDRYCEAVEIAQAAASCSNTEEWVELECSSTYLYESCLCLERDDCGGLIQCLRMVRSYYCE